MLHLHETGASDLLLHMQPRCLLSLLKLGSLQPELTLRLGRRQPEVEMIDWDISPEAITICQAPDGSDRLWELGRSGSMTQIWGQRPGPLCEAASAACGIGCLCKRPVNDVAGTHPGHLSLCLAPEIWSLPPAALPCSLQIGKGSWPEFLVRCSSRILGILEPHAKAF